MWNITNKNEQISKLKDEFISLTDEKYKLSDEIQIYSRDSKGNSTKLAGQKANLDINKTYFIVIIYIVS